MWKDTGINAVVAITGVIWIIAVAWLIGEAVWPGLPALWMWKYATIITAICAMLALWAADSFFVFDPHVRRPDGAH
jgi:hypothetical protein